MNKYFVLYRVPVETMADWQKNTSKEEMMTQGKKLMEDMNAWIKKHAKNFLDRGQPLGKTKRVTKEGASDVRNDLNYYQIVEAESHEAAAKLFADCPHLGIPTSFLDVMEIPHMGL